MPAYQIYQVYSLTKHQRWRKTLSSLVGKHIETLESTDPRKRRSCFTNVEIAQHEKAMVWQCDKKDQLYNVFVRHGIIGVRWHQCRITKTVETPTACDTTTLRQDITNRLGEIRYIPERSRR